MTEHEQRCVKVYNRQVANGGNPNCECNVCDTARVAIARRQDETFRAEQEKELTLFQPQPEKDPR